MHAQKTHRDMNRRKIYRGHFVSSVARTHSTLILSSHRVWPAHVRQIVWLRNIEIVQFSWMRIHDKSIIILLQYIYKLWLGCMALPVYLPSRARLYSYVCVCVCAYNTHSHIQPHIDTMNEEQKQTRSRNIDKKMCVFICTYLNLAWLVTNWTCVQLLHWHSVNVRA